MSFDRRPGSAHKGDLPPDIEQALEEEGVEVTDHEVELTDHPGSRSLGPQPYVPRHPAHEPPADEDTTDED